MTGNNRLSENLTKEIIDNTHFETDDIVQMFQGLSAKGYSAMNLKLVLDLLGSLHRSSIEQEEIDKARMPS
jgi:hypothetical protein